MLRANKIRKVETQVEKKVERRVEKKTKTTKRTLKPTSQPGTNIQVFLRCKNGGLTSSKEDKYLRSIGADPLRDVLLCSNTSSNNTVYGFNRVFKEDSSQKQVFDEVALPIINDVLKGYCCTIFAYGQTGTGKTYTMEGDNNGIGIGLKAGIIPRIIQNLFQQIGTVNKDNYITVSMLELYNEELHDLLTVTDDYQQSGLTIYEDKGLGVKVHNLREIPIETAAMGIKLLQSGIKKRMTAATNYNEKSSRSHSIFTINIYKKNIKSDTAEDFIVGRLNLVDLAGSENTKTAGSMKSRAREASAINKSLLTLGRVITSLVEKSPHIPYRESKLTRLLKDSLGGSTKTCIIATISPSSQTIDDIRSTLEYASKAKQISNTPASHLHIGSSRFEENIAGLVEKLMDQLVNCQERNGVYMSKSDYERMQAENRSLKESKEALEEESRARALAEEARFDLLEQKYQQKFLDMQQQLLASRTREDRLAAEAQSYKERLAAADAENVMFQGFLQKQYDATNSFLESRKRSREDD